MPLRVSDNKRYLVNADNTPFFYLGDTAWDLSYRLNREEIARYLEDRAAKGFTVIHMVALSEFGQLDRPSMSGHLPFADKDPTKPIEPFFAYLDYIVDTAQALGLYIGLLPVWGDHVGPTLWGDNPIVLNPGNAGVYGRYLGARFRGRNVIWITGGDRPVETDEQLATWRALGAGLRESSPENLISFHPTGGTPPSMYFQNDDWLDFNMIQTSHSGRDVATYDAVEKDYDMQPVKPTFEAEYCYENHPENWIPAQGRFDDYDVRKGAYWSLFAGGFGFCYGCNDIFSFWEPGLNYAPYDKFTPCKPWKESLQLTGAWQMRHIRTLLEGRPFLTRIPDQSLVISEIGSGSHHVRATRNEDGAYAFVYVASGRPVTVDLSKLSGDTIQAYWYDPRNGLSTGIGAFVNGGAREFTPPSTGYAADWVLVLDDASRGYAAPGDRRDA